MASPSRHHYHYQSNPSCPLSATIFPPLLNSASVWATDYAQLCALYDSPHTGAITTRTCVIADEGFRHDERVHQVCFFPEISAKGSGGVSSLNTLGYSPLGLKRVLELARKIFRDSGEKDSNEGKAATGREKTGKKLIIVSIAGSAGQLRECYAAVKDVAIREQMPLAVEVNLSCPNLVGKPPPGYDREELKVVLEALKNAKIEMVTKGWERGNGESSGEMKSEEEESRVMLGLKLPPYTWRGQFETLVDAIANVNAFDRSDGSADVVNFLTSTNTLGSSLLLSPENDDQGRKKPRLNSEAGTGIGGLAGDTLHPLALGNVKTLRSMLDEKGLERVGIIGVGGVGDRAGFERMRSVGADVVGVATALGREGVGIFGRILEGEQYETRFGKGS